MKGALESEYYSLMLVRKTISITKWKDWDGQFLFSAQNVRYMQHYLIKRFNTPRPEQNGQHFANNIFLNDIYDVLI